ncbi:MAG: AAA family ATPase [Deltaproteobacteria bacterium]|nr:AAA family ATPase [Deltaproteobacteria bacterium]
MRKRPSLSPDEFPGTARFKVIRRIGAGGMGVVYEALDREKSVLVALKTLRTRDGESVLRLKQEFRTLQDVQHPNLVALGELIEEGGVWFFTMELIHGVSFLKYVRPRWDQVEGVSPHGDTGRALTATTPLPAHVGAAALTTLDEPPPEIRPPLDAALIFDEPRLRSAMAQLAAGLLALHAAGKIHRDVKPSNIMVTEDDRVVILDFGLATSVEHGGTDSDSDSAVVGTALYMAPEQALGERVGPEADWYSVGVVLYEALVGVPPFLGPNLQVLMDKQRIAPPTPMSERTGVPEDLDALAVELLRFDPAARPSGRDIQRRLRVSGDLPVESVSARTQTAPFVGREAELALLATALADVRTRRQVTVYLHGESGIGKSALVRAFCKRVASDQRVVVLAGRCYEREAVPYKAVDGIIDELASYVQRLSQVEAAALTPQSADLLLQVFPVLSRIEVFASTPRHAVRDAKEQRSRLFAAIRELLTRLCDRHTVIMAIDDLQWADADSLAMLSEVLRPPDAPALLFLASWREAGEAPGGIRERLENLPGEIRHLAIEKLSADATTELATLLLARSGVAAARADEIAREANGHPLFVDELVRFTAARDRDASIPLEHCSLEEALGNRLARLEPGPMRVLELLALAGAPLEQETCAHAAGIAVGNFAQVAAQLRTAHFARTGGARKLDRIEPYHDRVRDTVLAHLGADRRRMLHSDLARALEASGRADPEALAVHHAGAGANDKAATYAALAAAAATRAVAFDRAARLYQMALDLTPPGPAVRDLQIALGAALAKAGRGAEAGRALLAAAHGAPVAQAMDLRARAIQALLNAGHFDQGIAELCDVLATQRVAYPRTARRALLSVVGQRALLALRGLRFRECDESQVAHEVLARIDLQYYAATTLAPIDNVRGHSFQVRGLRLALKAGERYRVARTLVTEAGYRALAGGAAIAKGDQLLDTADALGTRVDNPHLISLLVAGRATAAFLKGAYVTSLDRCHAAQALARHHGVSEFAEFNLMYQWIAESLTWLGRLVELAPFLAHSIRDGEERGNLYLSTTLRTAAVPFVRLAADDAAAARAEVTDALDRWSPQRFHVQHFYALRANASIDLYDAHGFAAFDRIQREWPEFAGALLLRVSFARTYMWDLRARAAVCAAAAKPAEQDRLLRLAEQDARRIVREKMAWSTPLAGLIRACIAARRGNSEIATKLFEQAAREFDAVDLLLHAAAARRRLGALVGGERGSTLIAAADGWMAGQQITSPERMTAMLAPG